MLVAVFLLIQLGFVVFLFFLTIAFVTGAPFVPSTKLTAQAMIRLAKLKPGMRIYDLGSGDGRLLFLAAKEGVTAIGFEINPFLVVFSWIKKMASDQRDHIGIHWQNFWNTKLSDADVVFIYLLPWKMDALSAKLKKELKPGINSFQ